MIRSKSEYVKAKLWHTVFRWIEIGNFVVSALILFWLIYGNYCATTLCQEFAIKESTFFLLLQLILPLSAVVNSTRIAASFILTDPDEDSEPLFYVSLVGLALCYIVFGLFFQHFLELSTKKERTDSGLFTTQIIILIVTVVSQLKDKHTWEKSNNFVKARIAFSLLNQTILLINPIFGLIMALLASPFLIFLKDPASSVTFNPDLNPLPSSKENE